MSKQQITSYPVLVDLTIRWAILNFSMSTQQISSYLVPVRKVRYINKLLEVCRSELLNKRINQQKAIRVADNQCQRQQTLRHLSDQNQSCKTHLVVVVLVVNFIDHQKLKNFTHKQVHIIGHQGRTQKEPRGSHYVGSSKYKVILYSGSINCHIILIVLVIIIIPV